MTSLTSFSEENTSTYGIKPQLRSHFTGTWTCVVWTQTNPMGDLWSFWHWRFYCILNRCLVIWKTCEEFSVYSNGDIKIHSLRQRLNLYLFLRASEYLEDMMSLPCCCLLCYIFTVIMLHELHLLYSLVQNHRERCLKQSHEVHIGAWPPFKGLTCTRCFTHSLCPFHPVRSIQVVHTSVHCRIMDRWP